MQSVFSTKDDAGGDGMKLIVDDGKILWGKTTKTNDNDCMASWFAEITSVSSAEEEEGGNDSSTSVSYKTVPTDGDSASENLRPVECLSDTTKKNADTPVDQSGMAIAKLKIIRSSRDGQNNGERTAVLLNEGRISRMSLRQRTPPKLTLKSKMLKGRGAGPKVMCPRGRGGRIMRTFGFKSCKDAKALRGLWLSSVDDVNLREDVDEDDHGPLETNDGCRVETQRSRSSDSGVSNLDSLESVTDGIPTEKNVPEAERHVIKKLNTDTSISLHHPKESGIFNEQNIFKIKMFSKRRRLNTSKGSQTNTDCCQSSSSCVSETPVPQINGTQKKVTLSGKRQKVAENGVATDEEKTMRKPEPHRDYARKKVENSVEVSTKALEMNSLARHKTILPQSNVTSSSLSSSLPSTILPPTVLRPPILFVKNINKHSSKISAKCDDSSIASSSSKFKSTITGRPSEDRPMLKESPALPEVQRSPPILLIKAVHKYTLNDVSKVDRNPIDAPTLTKAKSTPELSSKATEAFSEISKQRLVNLKPLSNEGAAKSNQMQANKPNKGTTGTVWRLIKPAPIAPSSAADFSKSVATTTTIPPVDGSVELVSTHRATKSKAIQKISAIVTRKKKMVDAKLATGKKKRSNENVDVKDKEAKSVSLNCRVEQTNVDCVKKEDVADGSQLPPPPLLIPCSMSRTEELQRRSLQDKLLTSAAPSTLSNLQCRVNIPQLDRYPLSSKGIRSPSPPPTPPPPLPVDFSAAATSSKVETSAQAASSDVEKRPLGRPRIHRPPNAVKPTRFSRNGRRIGRPPIRSLVADSVPVRDTSASELSDVSPALIANQELKHLRLLSPMLSGLNLPGFGGSKAAGHNTTCVDLQPQRSSTRQTECAFRYREITLRKHDNFTQIVLTSSTRVKNGLNCQVLRELKMALDAARTDKNCHVVLFNGAGSVFCSGIDLISLVKDGQNTSIAKELSTALSEFCKAAMSFPKTLVAAVNGAAVGLGVTMLPLFDMVYASDKATFYTPYVKLGQIPEGGATFSLPLAMGFARANGLLMGGRRITATEAFDCGLVTQVLWPAAFMEGVIPQVQALARQSLQTMGSAKALIRYHSVRELEVTLDIECRILAEQWASPECIQSIREFLDKEEVV